MFCIRDGWEENMIKDHLTDEELARALKEYLKQNEHKNDYSYREINNLLEFDYKLNNEIDIINADYEYKLEFIDNDDSKFYDYRDDSIALYGDSFLQQEEIRASFFENSSSVLNSRSPKFLRLDELVILESIKRNVNSIAFAFLINDNIQLCAIEEAKKQGYILTNDSPSFLKKHMEIIKQSLKLDPNSAIYIDWKAMKKEDIVALEKYVIEHDLDFAICSHTPINYKRNLNICIKSAKCDPDSLIYVDWKYFTGLPQELNKLLYSLIEQKYVLRQNSPEILKNCIGLCLNSIKIDINSAKFFSPTLTYWISRDLEQFHVGNKNSDEESIKDDIVKIRHYLLEHEYYSSENFFKFSSALLKDEIVLDYYLKQLGISNEGIDGQTNVYYERIKSFVTSSLLTPLKISDVKKVFQMVALKKWEEYRRQHRDYYANIFNRICDSLEKNNNFIDALNELRFLIKVEDVLDEKKYALFTAFIEYHQIYHNSRITDKIELLQLKRDEISKNAALFISKSKESFLSEKIAEFDQLFKQFFIIRIDNPIVKKKVVEVKQREMLKKMFREHDKSLVEKIFNLSFS